MDIPLSSQEFTDFDSERLPVHTALNGEIRNPDSGLTPCTTYLEKLPKEILLVILKLVKNTSDLITLMRTHPRLKEVCDDKELWVHIINPPDRYEILNSMINEYGNEKTKTFQITSIGKQCSYSPLIPSLLDDLGCKLKNLTKLALIGQNINGAYFRFSILPSGLKAFYLTGSTVNVDRFVAIPNEEQPYDIEASLSFFKGIETALPELEDLDVSSCSWILPLDLIHIRKLKKLVRLNLNGCRFDAPSSKSKSAFEDCPSIRRLQWRRVFSAIASSGFDTLKILDLTNTDINRNQFLSSFFRNRNGPVLEELYLGYYDHTHFPSWNNYNYRLQNTTLFSKATNLKVLDLSGFTIPDIHFAAQLSPTKLEKLFLYSSNILTANIVLLNSIVPNALIVGDNSATMRWDWD